MSIENEKFIQRAKNKHGNKYGYNLVKYVNCRTPIKIICPLHGKFEQLPQVHLSKNKNGDCPKCSYIARGMKRKIQNDWWKYEKSKIFVNNLGLTCRREWYKYCKSNIKPIQLPFNPKSVYKDEWCGWPGWIGTNGRTKNFLSFEDARSITRTFNIRSFEDWVHFSTTGNRPINIPFMPKQIYKDQWVSWGNWLGYESRANGNLPGIIYILQYGDLPNNVYKIGRTYRLEKRLSEHQRVNKMKIEVIKTFEVPIMSIGEIQAHEIALSIGKRFKYKKSTEHFEIDDINSALLLFESEFS